MSTPLETLRALSRSARPQYEINEINEITPPRNEESPLSRPDEGLNSLNSFLSSPGNADALDERAAIVECGAGVPRGWAEGFAALCSMPAPTGFSSERWERIVDAILDALRAAGSSGLTRTEISNLFSRNVSASQITRALGELTRRRLAMQRRGDTSAGRPPEIWIAGEGGVA